MTVWKRGEIGAMRERFSTRGQSQDAPQFASLYYPREVDIFTGYAGCLGDANMSRDEQSRSSPSQFAIPRNGGLDFHFISYSYCHLVGNVARVFACIENTNMYVILWQLLAT